MKLAEALKLRSDYNSRLSYLHTRIMRNCLVQEGDTPSEDFSKVLNDYLAICEKLKVLVMNIAISNAELGITHKGEEIKLCQAIVLKNDLEKRGCIYREVASQGVVKVDSYSKKEIKTVSLVDVTKFQKLADEKMEEAVILDNEIQKGNWALDLIEYVK